jgi:hypothetical protein
VYGHQPTSNITTTTSSTRHPLRSTPLVHTATTITTYCHPSHDDGHVTWTTTTTLLDSLTTRLQTRQATSPKSMATIIILTAQQRRRQMLDHAHQSAKSPVQLDFQMVSANYLSMLSRKSSDNTNMTESVTSYPQSPRRSLWLLLSLTKAT